MNDYSTEYTLETTLMTQEGRVEILRWDVDDYSAEFLDADYSVRGSLRDIIAELSFSKGGHHEKRRNLCKT